jgi:hypothetical protein
MDLTVPAARQAWLRTALAALSHDFIDGLFVDKAKAGAVGSFHGVSEAGQRAWEQGHQALLVELGAATPKKLILNNADRRGQRGMGQLFERWGESPDHDGLTLGQDIRALRRAATRGVTALARGGGMAPGSPTPDPVACGAALAAFLVAGDAPNTAYFSCEPDFGSRPTTGWMSLLEEPIYSLPLGKPSGPAVQTANGLIQREFSGGAVALLNASAAKLGCVRWKAGEIYGKCPEATRAKLSPPHHSDYKLTR